MMGNEIRVARAAARLQAKPGNEAIMRRRCARLAKIARRYGIRGRDWNGKIIYTEFRRQREMKTARCNARALPPRCRIAFSKRAEEELCAHYNSIIRERCTIPAGWIGGEIRERAGGLTLIASEYWYEYSSRAGSRYVGGAYLCGRDDGQWFAVRVPRGTTTVSEALAYMMPAAVQHAQAAGLWTARQGDIFLVEKSRGPDNTRDLPSSHHLVVLPARHGREKPHRAIAHTQHGVCHVPDTVRGFRVYGQRTVEGGAAD